MNEENRKELERIELLDDPEQQGYKLARVLCKLTNCTPAVMLQSILGAEFEGVNGIRDQGVIRWCREQLAGCNDGDIS